jgi:hypothetical protein
MLLTSEVILSNILTLLHVNKFALRDIERNVSDEFHPDVILMTKKKQNKKGQFTCG